MQETCYDIALLAIGVNRQHHSITFVRLGSFASILACPRRVRFPFVSVEKRTRRQVREPSYRRSGFEISGRIRRGPRSLAGSTSFGSSRASPSAIVRAVPGIHPGGLSDKTISL